VLARSIFNHSMNYAPWWSGEGNLVEDPEEKIEALRALSSISCPDDGLTRVSPMSGAKSNFNSARTIEEFSAKVRQGPPIDDEPDYSFPTWAPSCSLEMTAGAPIDDPGRSGREVPGYAKHYVR